ncbi:pentatricopeptide repeat-containing protein At5g04780, mitochondrial-like [Abrus precatorius]|uniref:Pentatricopeptide repeat-containing protein At5g04780, mitochondrial-like n=1 Tax=Abrus precatorius TaxID=3816 RepID=A0A8B8KJ02_ABRPR|nr:pentatricopeptide repeat-containing protein At5g04780, mitochondrial-like [Abrus precatorius]
METRKKLSFLLRSCVAHSVALQCHAQSIVQGLLPNTTLETDLLLAYSKLGFLCDSRKMFDKMLDRKNKYSWNIMIASYAQRCVYFDALTIFREFKCYGLRPDHYTLPPLFKVSIGVDDDCIGNMCHGLVIRLGYEGYVVVANSMLEFYVKFGALPQACCVFSSMLCKDSVSWNLMISGYGRASLYSDAMCCFREMSSLNGMMRVDFMTLPSILNACGNKGDLLKVREVHGYVVRSFGFDADSAIGNALIDMYGKCGCLNDSEKVFRTMHYMNLVTWTTMISCYGVHGMGEESLLLFKKMVDKGLKPSPVTLTAILASCSHSGLIDQGKHIFSSIRSHYGFEPTVEHYACMVDLLSRCGYLAEALQLLESMKSSATGSMWGALLAGCVTHKNVEVGEIAAHRLFQLEPNNASNYIALCGIYQSHGMLNGLSTVRAKMRDLGLVKSAGCSWINIAGRTHKFYQGDLSHPLARMICKIIYQISNTRLLTNDLIVSNMLHDDHAFIVGL